MLLISTAVSRIARMIRRSANLGERCRRRRREVSRAVLGLQKLPEGFLLSTLYVRLTLTLSEKAVCRLRLLPSAVCHLVYTRYCVWCLMHYSVYACCYDIYCLSDLSVTWYCVWCLMDYEGTVYCCILPGTSIIYDSTWCLLSFTYCLFSTVYYLVPVHV